MGLGVFSPFVGWLLWGAITGLWLNRHPPLHEPEERLDAWRRFWLVVGLIIFALSFAAAPLKPIAAG